MCMLLAQIQEILYGEDTLPPPEETVEEVDGETVSRRFSLVFHNRYYDFEVAAADTVTISPHVTHAYTLIES